MSNDIREDIEAAMDQVAGGGGSDAPAAAPNSVDSGPAAGTASVGSGGGGDGGTKPDAAVGGGRSRDAQGRFAPGAGGVEAKGPAKPAAAATLAPATAGAAPAKPAAGAASAPADAAAVAELRAPQSWKPLAREKWSSVPPEAQQEILRLDKEVRQTMQEAAPARKFAAEFQQTVAPFEGMIRAEGSNPLQAIGNLLQTAAALRTAPPTHKAQLVAGLIKTFGVPIEDLDSILAGEQAQGGRQQAQPQPQQFRDPRLDALLTQREHHIRQQVSTELAEFEKTHEFFDDVRDDMADLVAMAHQRGVALTTEEAYNKAIRLHPELSKVLEQREAAKAAANAQASTQRTRAAASSVKSQPAGPVEPAQPDDLRSVIKAAMRGS